MLRFNSLGVKAPVFTTEGISVIIFKGKEGFGHFTSLSLGLIRESIVIRGFSWLNSD